MIDLQDNKTAYSIATSVFNTLVKAKLLTSDKSQANSTKDTIFQAIKATPIKQTNTQKKDTEKKEKFELAEKLSKDKEFARGWLIQEMARQTGQNNATAAKELRDILQIASDNDDLSIEVVSYKNAVLECPECGADLCKPELPSNAQNIQEKPV